MGDQADLSNVLKALNDEIKRLKEKGAFEAKIVDILPEEGESGILYLLLRDPGDRSKGATEHIWVESKEDYEEVGDLDIDLSDKANIYRIGGSGSLSNLSVGDNIAGASISIQGNGYNGDSTTITFTDGSYITSTTGLFPWGGTPPGGVFAAYYRASGEIINIASSTFVLPDSVGVVVSKTGTGFIGSTYTAEEKRIDVKDIYELILGSVKLTSNKPQKVLSDIILGAGNKLFGSAEDDTPVDMLSIDMVPKESDLSSIPIGFNVSIGTRIKFDTSKVPIFKSAIGPKLIFNTSDCQIVAGRAVTEAGTYHSISAEIAGVTTQIYNSNDGWINNVIEFPKTSLVVQVTENNLDASLDPSSEWTWSDATVFFDPQPSPVFGSLNTDSNIKSKNQPTYETPEGKRLISHVFETVDKEGEPLNVDPEYLYNTKQEKSPEDNKTYVLKNGGLIEHKNEVIDITSMFNVGVNVDFAAFLFKRNSDDDKPLIKIHGFNNSESTEDLKIIPTMGFGANYDSYQTARETLDGVTFTDYVIKVSKEYTGREGSIIIPYGVKSFSVNYYLHDGNNRSSQYNQTYYFELENTPVGNFCATGGSDTLITINNNSVMKSAIKSIAFGDSYNNITSVPTNFLYYFTSLTSVDLIGLKNLRSTGVNFLRSCPYLTALDLTPLSNLTSTGDGFIYGCTRLTELDLVPLSGITSTDGSFLGGCANLDSIDLTPLSSLISIGKGFLSSCVKLTSLDFTSLRNLTSIGYGFLESCTGLVSIQIGDVDWSGKSVATNSLMRQVPNVSTSILYADTQEIADAFKLKMNGAISEWTVILNN